MAKIEYSKYGYKEYVFNGSKLRKLYYMYLHQSVFDKVLDVLVVFAILFTVAELFLHLFLHLPEYILHILHSFTVLIFFVFGLELYREYAKSKSHKHFFRKHGVDFVLVVFLSFYFFAGAYLGLAKIRVFADISKFASRFKQLKIVSKIGKVKF